MIPYRELLDVFWTLHDPTSRDRQGADEGPQYRSAIYYHSDAQKREAEESLRLRQQELDRPIVTDSAAAQ